MGITLLRHCAPPKIYHGRYIGWSNIEIDRTLFSESKVKKIMQKEFDTIYSSNLKRATNTLEVMGKKDFIVDARLKEVKFKEEFEGKDFGMIEKLKSFKLEYLDSAKRWHDYICEESYEEFEERVKSFLNDINKDKEILICAHGGTIRKILTLLNPDIYKENLTLQLDYLDNITV